MNGIPEAPIDWSRFDVASTDALRAMDRWTALADQLGTAHLDTLRLRSDYLARRDTETAEWVRIRDQILARTHSRQFPLQHCCRGAEQARGLCAERATQMTTPHPITDQQQGVHPEATDTGWTPPAFRRGRTGPRIIAGITYALLV